LKWCVVRDDVVSFPACIGGLKSRIRGLKSGARVVNRPTAEDHRVNQGRARARRR
jgi:hypothetical protein